MNHPAEVGAGLGPGGATVGVSSAGYCIVVMGMVFAATAFTWVAPFAGPALSGAVVNGQWGTALPGIGISGATIAVPLVELALVPAWVSRLPKAWGWMNEVKGHGRAGRLAAALTFLVLVDLVWGWGCSDGPFRSPFGGRWP